jgi:diacylglycerol O-acyltransferase-1
VTHDIRALRRKVAAAKKSDSAPPLAPKAMPSAEILGYTPSLSHLYYFLAAPTLCFQLSYPRSPSVRWGFALRRAFEVVFCTILQLAMIQQYCIPTVANAMPAFEQGDWLVITERILKLAIPNTFIWLLMFYQLFHSWLNLTAELLRFGDRLFYKSWWNSQTLDVYWRNWNLPVHNWVIRHLYAPALRAGFSPFTAQLVSFFISALLHEVMVSVPTHSLQTHAFLGMILQVPLIALSRFLTHTLKQPNYGNSVFWLSFCILGQPLAVLLYAREFVKRNQITLL